MNQLELNKARAEVMLGAKYDENGKCTNVKSCYKDGDMNREGVLIEHTNWDWVNFNYRLIPEPAEIKYKPYSKVDENWLGKKVKRDEFTSFIITAVDTRKSHYSLGVMIGNQWADMKHLFYYTWENGTPCGEVDNG